MTSDMKSTLLTLIIIITFSEGKSFFINEFLNFLVPKNPGLMKVRKMDQTEEMSDAKILDFVRNCF